MKALTLIPSVAASVAIGVLIGANLVTLSVSAQDVEKPAEAKAEAKAEVGVVRGTAFQLVDAEGALRGEFKLSEAGTPNLWLIDKEGESFAQFEDVDAAAEMRKKVRVMEAHIEEVMKREEVTDTRIEVQHILLGVRSDGPPQLQQMSAGFSYGSADEAKAAAAKVFERIQAGEDFTALVRELTDDGLSEAERNGEGVPGVYTIITEGQPDNANKVFPRKGLVAAFGDVGFKLQVGEVGVAAYDLQSSPFGYHIIKRIK